MSIRAVDIQATRLMPADFQRKSEMARYQCVRRWSKKHSFVHRMLGTHESQRSQTETAEIVLDYVELIRPRLVQNS